ncbi:50S ribosomal protein L18 [Candidatus Woesearchaeota archaeon]|nr:50S ribosomal protein L18 [Candidatus Woesearchaeota archaeon]
MKESKPHPVPLRRKKVTNYRKRRKLLVSRTVRLVVRKSLKHIGVQAVSYYPTGDKVLLSAYSRELSSYGWNLGTGNIPAAYLTGLLFGTKAKTMNLDKAILDIGLIPSTKGSRIYALVKGALDAGFQIPCAPDMLPTQERLAGAHIVAYAQSFKEGKHQFSQRMPVAMSTLFTDVKQRILQGVQTSTKSKADVKNK